MAISSVVDGYTLVGYGRTRFLTLLDTDPRQDLDVFIWNGIIGNPSPVQETYN